MNAEGERMCLKHAQRTLKSALTRAREAQEMRGKVPPQNRSELVVDSLAAHSWLTDEFAPDDADADPPDVEVLADIGRTEGMTVGDLDTSTILETAAAVDEYGRELGVGVYSGEEQ